MQPAEYRNSLNLAKKQTHSYLRLDSFLNRVIDNGNNLSNYVASSNKTTFQTDLTHTGKTPKQVTTVYTRVATFMNHNLISCFGVPGTLLTHRSSSEYSRNNKLDGAEDNILSKDDRNTPSTDYDIEGEEMYDYIMTTAQMI